MSWVKTPAAAKHFGVSVKTFRKMLQDGFPHSRLPSGGVLINLKAGDEYLTKECSGSACEKKKNEILLQVLA